MPVVKCVYTQVVRGKWDFLLYTVTLANRSDCKKPVSASQIPLIKCQLWPIVGQLQGAPQKEYPELIVIYILQEFMELIVFVQNGGDVLLYHS